MQPCRRLTPRLLTTRQGDRRHINWISGARNLRCPRGNFEKLVCELRAPFSSCVRDPRFVSRAPRTMRLPFNMACHICEPFFLRLAISIFLG